MREKFNLHGTTFSLNDEKTRDIVRELNEIKIAKDKEELLFKLKETIGEKILHNKELMLFLLEEPQMFSLVAEPMARVINQRTAYKYNLKPDEAFRTVVESVMSHVEGMDYLSEKQKKNARSVLQKIIEKERKTKEMFTLQKAKQIIAQTTHSMSTAQRTVQHVVHGDITGFIFSMLSGLGQGIAKTISETVDEVQKQKQDKEVENQMSEQLKEVFFGKGQMTDKDREKDNRNKEWERIQAQKGPSR